MGLGKPFLQKRLSRNSSPQKGFRWIENRSYRNYRTRGGVLIRPRPLDGEAGPLERYLGVWDNGFDRTRVKIRELLALWSVDKCPDRWLPLLAPKVGHVFDSSRGYDWNRRRIRHAIERWSYKGARIAWRT